MSTLSELTDYLKHPYFTQEREPLTPRSFGMFLKLLGFTFIAITLTGMITGFLFKTLGTEGPQTTRDFDDVIENSGLYIIVFIVPFIEEFLFRFWLGRRWGILVVLPTLLVMAALILAKISLKDLNVALSLLLLLVVAGYLITTYRRTSIYGVHDDRIQTFFPYLFWGTSISFALMHLGNFNTSGIGLLAVIIVLPQFIAGTMMGYIRMRLGFLAGFAFHAAYNGIIMMMVMSAGNGA